MRRSNFFKISLLTTSTLLILVEHVFASAAYQADSIALDPITRSQILSSGSNDGEFSDADTSKKMKKTIGFETVTSDNVDMYILPIAYGFPMNLLGERDYLNLSADFLYLNIEAPSANETGLSDVRVGAEYFIRKNIMLLKCAVDLKFPTGDEDLGLGTGSSDLGLSLTGRMRKGDVGFNATVGYIFRGEADPNGIDVDYGNVINLVGGGEFQIKPTLWAGAKLAYVRAGTSEFNNGIEGDGLQTVDLIPNAWYRLSEQITVSLDIIYPLIESVIEGDFAGSEPDREMSLNFGVNSEF